ncbi:MAG: hypothetical protein K6F46_00760 [Desulfovibrio sp.]|nr:hypothetical protein [Desulfovibrio sp.]
MLKSFVFFWALLVCLSSAHAFEMPKLDTQFFKQTWEKVRGAAGEAADSMKGMGNEGERKASAADPVLNASNEEKIFSKVWRKFSDVSNEAARLATEDDRNSRTLMEFLTAREPKYVRLLKKAQDILSDSEAREQFDRIDELTLRNKALQEKIVTLKRDRISAPVTSYNPLADTKERIDKKLAGCAAEIEENKSQIQGLKVEVAQILKKNGITLSPEEVEYFIVSAEGSELVRLMAIAGNTKRIQGVIERELQQDKNNVNLAKYYTGMYFISLETYMSAHDAVLAKIPEYRKKVAEISQEAARNRDEALSLKRSASGGDAANITANIAINERIIAVAKMYDELLRKRMTLLRQSRENIEKKVKIASNTYRTIANGSALISLVNTESGEFSLLVSFDMPELKMIYDGAMLNAFIEISDRIKAEK